MEPGSRMWTALGEADRPRASVQVCEAQQTAPARLQVRAHTCKPAVIIRFTALPPPPPQPMTLIRASATPLVKEATHRGCTLRDTGAVLAAGSRREADASAARLRATRSFWWTHK